MPSVYSKQTLEAVLENYLNDTLVEMAQATGLLVSTARRLSKADVIKLLATHLLARERVRAAYAALNETEQRTLQRLILRGGEATKRVFERDLVRARIVMATQAVPDRWQAPPYASTERMASTAPGSLYFQDVLARLTQHGLLFSVDLDLAGQPTAPKLRLHPAALVFIPDAMRKHLPAAAPEQEALVDLHPERVLQHSAITFVRDLFLYWDFVRRTSPALLQSGAIGKRTLRALDAVLIEHDPGMASASSETDAPRGVDCRPNWATGGQERADRRSCVVLGWRAVRTTWSCVAVSA
jgi:hypothetical protein